MTSMWFKRLWDVINYICCYVTVNLGRGVFFSCALLFVVMLLRKLPFFQNCFRRMILWSFFLWLPFTGGLKLFYETRFGVRGFLWWANRNYEHRIIGQVYFLVMAVYGGYLFYQRRKLRRFVKGLDSLTGNVYICENMVTPFTTGLLFPKIIVPAEMVRQYSSEDLKTILLHEKMHIRLGHLWWLFLWDVLRVLFWPNFFLTICMKMLKTDMEEMCDRVTIQKSGKSACDYGMLLLRSIRLLYPLKSGKMPVESVALAGAGGKNGYRDIKYRIQKIALFSRYRIKDIIAVSAVWFLLIGGGFFGIYENSYARYTELEDVTVFDDTGCHVILQDSERLRQAVTFDEHKVYVDVPEMKDMLEESGSQTEGIYIMFGGFMKQPGVGGCCDMAYAGLSELSGEQAEIAYESNMDLLAWIVKMI